MRVLQLKVGTVSLVLPSQTELGVHLLLSSSPPPLATFPNSKTNEGDDKDKASEENVGPPAQDLGLEFFLLFALGYGGFLALVGRKQSVCGVSGNINAAHPRLNEAVMSLVLIGDRHDVSKGIIVECATFDAVKTCQAA